MGQKGLPRARAGLWRQQPARRVQDTKHAGPHRKGELQTPKRGKTRQSTRKEMAGPCNYDTDTIGNTGRS